MVLTRKILIQVAVFIAISIVAIGVMAFSYMRLPNLLFGAGHYRVTLELPETATALVDAGRSPQTPVAVTRVGTPGRVLSGTSSWTSRPASSPLAGSTSAVIMTLIAGRIGMPVVCNQASAPFIPRSAKSIRLTAVSPAPMTSATTAMPVR